MIISFALPTGFVLFVAISGEWIIHFFHYKAVTMSRYSMPLTKLALAVGFN
jgi:hypothetical protein